MSRIYDNWEKLVGSVLRREEDRQLALCESFSSSSSADLSSRFSFSFSFNAFLGVSKQRIFSSRDLMAVDYREIEEATKNFHPDMLLSYGGFGRVYRGCGTAVAFKKMYDEGTQGDEEWMLLQREINYLSQLRHPNLAKLIGYSFGTDNNRIAIYEFMAGGSLDHHLFTRGHQSLPWATRIKVAIGAARALAFLHDLEIPAIHRNFKSGAILLDDDFNTKLLDFGLARDGSNGSRTHISTRVMGAYGYAAPEYWTTGRLTTRSDVFGLGVVLLELISGLRVFHSMRSEGRHNLSDWAKPRLRDKRNLSQFMDSRLEGQYRLRQAYGVGQIALRCVSSYPRSRPRMSVIVADLETL